MALPPRSPPQGCPAIPLVSSRPPAIVAAPDPRRSCFTVVIMSLPPEQLPSPAGPVRGGDPLVEELCNAALEAHRRLLENLLRELDRAAAPAGGAPARSWSELAGRIRPHRPALQRRYLREIGRRFNAQAQSGGSADRELQRYTRPPSEALEEQIALDALTRRLRATQPMPLTRLEQRLRLLAQRSALPIPPGAYAPGGATEAFRIALEALDLEWPQRSLLFALYEPAAAAALGGLFEEALAILERRAPGSASTGAGPAADAPAAAEPSVDEATLQALRREQAGGMQRADARLAAALLAIARNTSSPVAQRLALLGQLYASWLTPLSAAAGSDIEKLRFTLIKIVLVDSAFLLSASHPLRLMLREACERQDERRRRQVCARIEQVALSASFVHDSLSQLPLLSTQQVEACLALLRPRDDDRHEDARLGEARRKVAKALEHATLLHARPQGLRLFLRAGWGPLLTQRFLKHGSPSLPWQQALDQLDHLLNALSDGATRVRDFESLLTAAAAELFDAGMRSDRCERLQQALREAFYELRTDTTAIGDAVPSKDIATAFLPGNGVLDLIEDAAATAGPGPSSLPGRTQIDLELIPMSAAPLPRR